VIPRGVAIWCATESVDLRKSFDTLAGLVRDVLREDPGGGALFLFTNTRRDRLKVLWWDRNGYCILYKRLERGVFRIPEPVDRRDACITIDARELARILEGVDLSAAKLRMRDEAHVTNGSHGR
jgi:transposase